MLLTQSNYERKAHLEGRQKSAPFSVSQLSPPPHHVFLKPGAVPSTKCTGKHILGPAVIWSWRIGCEWIRNQLIGPGTMWPLVRLRERPLPSAPPPLPQPAFRRARCQEGFCNMPCAIPSRQPCAELQLFSVLNDMFLVLWETLGGGCCSLFGSGCTASHGLILISVCKLLWGSHGSSTWDHSSSGIPGAGNLRGSCFSSAPQSTPCIAQICPRNEILSGLTTLPKFCGLCTFMTLSKHYGN